METRLGGQDVALEPVGDDDEERLRADRLPRRGRRRARPGCSSKRRPRSCAAPGLTQALESLDPRSRRIIEARWLTEKDPATLHDLADEFGVSAERVRQIEVKALAKMKGVIARKRRERKLARVPKAAGACSRGFLLLPRDLSALRCSASPSSRSEQHADVVQDRRGAPPVRREEPQPPFAVEAHTSPRSGPRCSRPS